MSYDLKVFSGLKKIAIMGGTFDPIHYGHLVTAQTVYSQFDVDKVIFIPTGKPYYKSEKDVTKSEHRYNMTALAIEDNNAFDVSEIEIAREGKTYTIDTIEQIYRLCNNDIEIYFIMGADELLQFKTWKDYEKLLSICDFIAVTRPGYDRAKLMSEVSDINSKFESKIHFVSVPQLEISSSDIRNRVRQGDAIRYLLPDNVIEYIRENSLYK